MKLRLTQLILLVVTVLVGSGFLLLLRSLLKDLEAQSFQATEEVMVDTSYRLAHIIERQLALPEQLSSTFCQRLFPYVSSTLVEEEIQIYSLRKTHIGLHFYITNEKGQVLFDSQQGRREGENFSTQNDVFLTLKGHYGARSSRIKKGDELSSVLYVAAPIYQNNTIIGVVTCYKPQKDVVPFIEARKAQIWQICLMIGGGMTLLVGAVFFWVYRPIGLLTQYTQAVIAGKRPRYPRLGAGREINTLGEALKTMRITLEGREYAQNYVQTLSHELKSPIAAIKASAEVLHEKMPEERRSRFLASISEQADRSERVITRLLQLSRIEQLSQLERMETVYIDQLMVELCDELESLATQNELEYITDLAASPINGDAFLLRAVFQNILENATKYALRGSAIFISTSASDENIIIIVKNTGEALPPYAPERIFERFYSLPMGGRAKSSGIGLALALEALELHQGTIAYHWLAPHHHFTITIPRERD